MKQNNHNGRVMQDSEKNKCRKSENGQTLLLAMLAVIILLLAALFSF